MLLAPQGIVVPGGAAVLTMEAYEEDGRLCCGVFELRGHLKLPPKAWLRTIRDELRKIERIARSAGCTELRLGGRDWSRVLKGMGYEPLDGIPNGLRKVLG